jgi:hypothetical protein
MRCGGCGAYRYPARERCDVCWSTDTEWAEASGVGTLFSWTVFHQVYHPAFAGRVPYVVAQVDLAEGPRILSTVEECDPAELRAEMPLRVAFRRLSDEVALPVFRPA